MVLRNTRALRWFSEEDIDPRIRQTKEVRYEARLTRLRTDSLYRDLGLFDASVRGLPRGGVLYTSLDP